MAYTFELKKTKTKLNFHPNHMPPGGWTLRRYKLTAVMKTSNRKGNEHFETNRKLTSSTEITGSQ